MYCFYEGKTLLIYIKLHLSCSSADGLKYKKTLTIVIIRFYLFPLEFIVQKAYGNIKSSYNFMG